jgi:disulfide bond formation protein DsbB
MNLSPQKVNYLALTLCLVLLSVAFYLQYVQEMEPCPLCYFQRAVIIVLAGLLLLARVLPKHLLLGLFSVASVTGMGLSARHIYIQNLPAEQVPACGQGITYMLESLPFFDVVTKVLKGSGECAKRDLFLGLTLPTWTLMFFISALLFGVWQWQRQSHTNRF